MLKGCIFKLNFLNDSWQIAIFYNDRSTNIIRSLTCYGGFQVFKSIMHIPYIDDICNSYCQSQISLFVGENYTHANDQR
jgi:hypothetical protein